MCLSYDFDNVVGLQDEYFLPALVMVFFKGKITDGMLMKKYHISIIRANYIIAALEELGVIDGKKSIIKYLNVSPNALKLYLEIYNKILDRVKNE